MRTFVEEDGVELRTGSQGLESGDVAEVSGGDVGSIFRPEEFRRLLFDTDVERGGAEAASPRCRVHAVPRQGLGRRLQQRGMILQREVPGPSEIQVPPPVDDGLGSRRALHQRHGHRFPPDTLVRSVGEGTFRRHLGPEEGSDHQMKGGRLHAALPRSRSDVAYSPSRCSGSAWVSAGASSTAGGRGAPAETMTLWV